MINSARLSSSKIVFLSSATNLVVVSLQAIVLTPLYLRNLGTTQYGAWLGAGDFLLWMQAMDFGISNFATQKMSAAYGKGDKVELISWFSSTVLILTSISALVVLIGWYFSSSVFNTFGLPQQQTLMLTNAFRIAVVGVGFTIFNYAFVGLSRSIQDPWIINIFNIFGSVLGFAVSYWALKHGLGVISIGYGIISRSLTSLIGSLVFILFQRKIFKDIGIIPKLSHIKESIYIAPLSAVGSIGYSVGNQSENAVISYFVSPDLAAAYNTMKKFGDMGKALLDTLSYASFAPFASEYANIGKDSKNSYVKILYNHSLLGIIMCAGLIIFNKDILKFWLNNNIYLGHWINALLAIQVFAVTRSYLLNSMNRAIDDPRVPYLILMIEALAKIGLYVIFIKRFGIFIIPLVSIGVSLLSAWILSIKNSRRLLVQDSQIMVVITLLICLGISRYTFQATNWFVVVLFFLLICISYLWYIKGSNKHV